MNLSNNYSNINMLVFVIYFIFFALTFASLFLSRTKLFKLYIPTVFLLILFSLLLFDLFSGNQGHYVYLKNIFELNSGYSYEIKFVQSVAPAFLLLLLASMGFCFFLRSRLDSSQERISYFLSILGLFFIVISSSTFVQLFGMLIIVTNSIWVANLTASEDGRNKQELELIFSYLFLYLAFSIYPNYFTEAINLRNSEPLTSILLLLSALGFSRFFSLLSSVGESKLSEITPQVYLNTHLIPMIGFSLYLYLQKMYVSEVIRIDLASYVFLIFSTIFIIRSIYQSNSIQSKINCISSLFLFCLHVLVTYGRVSGFGVFISLIWIGYILLILLNRTLVLSNSAKIIITFTPFVLPVFLIHDSYLLILCQSLSIPALFGFEVLFLILMFFSISKEIFSDNWEKNRSPLRKEDLFLFALLLIQTSFLLKGSFFSEWTNLPFKIHSGEYFLFDSSFNISNNNLPYVLLVFYLILFAVPILSFVFRDRLTKTSHSDQKTGLSIGLNSFDLFSILEKTVDVYIVENVTLVLNSFDRLSRRVLGQRLKIFLRLSSTAINLFNLSVSEVFLYRTELIIIKQGKFFQKLHSGKIQNYFIFSIFIFLITYFIYQGI